MLATTPLQAWLGHKNIQHTVRYTELAPDRFTGDRRFVAIGVTSAGGQPRSFRSLPRTCRALPEHPGPAVSWHGGFREGAHARQFITFLGGAVTASPLATRSEEGERMHRRAVPCGVRNSGSRVHLLVLREAWWCMHLLPDRIAHGQRQRSRMRINNTGSAPQCRVSRVYSVWSGAGGHQPERQPPRRPVVGVNAFRERRACAPPTRPGNPRERE
jgi:hypothetical protein